VSHFSIFIKLVVLHSNWTNTAQIIWL